MAVFAPTSGSGIAQLVAQINEVVQTVVAGPPSGHVKLVAPHRSPKFHPTIGRDLVKLAVELAVHGKVGAGGERVVGVVVAVPEFRTVDDRTEPVLDVLGTGGRLVGGGKHTSCPGSHKNC